jgi:uncharacterized protein YcfJ
MSQTNDFTQYQPAQRADSIAAETGRASRLHPLMAGAAAAVILVSLLGTAAITGLLPASRGTPAPAGQAPYAGLVNPQASLQTPYQPVQSASPGRYVTSDGQVLDVVQPAANAQVMVANPTAPGASVLQPRPLPHRVVHRQAQNSYQTQTPVYQQRTVAPAHPVLDYVSDMHPVGTGVGAVVGGLLGNHVGGGNGRKAATVAGILLGGYAGNEVAHDRNPLAW